MDDLRILTGKVCDVARTAGRFLKEERKSFRREAVEEKHGTTMCPMWTRSLKNALSPHWALFCPKPVLSWRRARQSTGMSRIVGWWTRLTVLPIIFMAMPPYCVSIALRNKHELLLGVVYDPCLDECFYAWKGGGAYLNGQSLQVSSVRSMEASFVVTELPYNSEQYARTGEYLIRELYGRVAGIRMNGSAAIALCYVAAGRFDAWLEAFLGKWDFSAAALIVQEAGGRVTDFLWKRRFHRRASCGRH